MYQGLSSSSNKQLGGFSNPTSNSKDDSENNSTDLKDKQIESNNIKKHLRYQTNKLKKQKEKSTGYKTLSDEIKQICTFKTNKKIEFMDSFSELLEKNYDEAEKFFIKYIKIIYFEPSLALLVEEFFEVYQGDSLEFKQKHLVSIFINKGFDNIKYFTKSNEEEQMKTMKLFDELTEISAKDAFSLYDKYFEFYFLENKLLSLAFEKNKKSFEPFIKAFKIDEYYIDGNQTINGNKIYQKGSEFNTGVDEKYVKTIIVLGETGSGKTTLLNSMVNYGLGVKYTDNIRLKLIVENEKSDQTESQTKIVTSYGIKPNSKICGFPIRLIDTPGFGDTRGSAFDIKNTKLICDFIYSSCPEIHGICFVMKASNTVLSVTQKYVTQQILNIFGEDAQENILAMLTFADNQHSHALDTLKNSNIKIKDHFTFNNSGIFAHEKQINKQVEKFYWDMGMKSFQVFFKKLIQIVPLSLKLTKEAFKVKDVLEIKLEVLNLNLKASLEKARNIEEEIKALNTIDTNNNGKTSKEKVNFTFKQILSYQRRINQPPGHCTTTCINCNYMGCHKGCTIEDDGKKHECRAMEQGRCVVCPGKCEWKMHKNLGYYHDQVSETREVSIQDLLQKYNINENIVTIEEIIKKIQSELESLMVDIIDIIFQSKQFLDGLNSIEEKVDTFNGGDCFKLIKIAEETEKSPGYNERIVQGNNVYQFYEFQYKDSVFKKKGKEKKKENEKKLVEFKGNSKDLHKVRAKEYYSINNKNCLIV